MPRLPQLAALAVAAGLIAGCAPPTDASVDDFCAVLNDFPTSFDHEQMDDYLDELKDTGTPEDIPGAAREGFELSIELLEEIDFDADDQDIADDIEERQADLSGDEEAKLEAFDAYQADTCGGDSS